MQGWRCGCCWPLLAAGASLPAPSSSQPLPALLAAPSRPPAHSPCYAASRADPPDRLRAIAPPLPNTLQFYQRLREGELTESYLWETRLLPLLGYLSADEATAVSRC